MRSLFWVPLLAAASLAAQLYVRAIYLDENDRRKRITSGPTTIPDNDLVSINANMHTWSSGMYTASVSGSSITVYNVHPVESYSAAERIQASIRRVINHFT